MKFFEIVLLLLLVLSVEILDLNLYVYNDSSSSKNFENHALFFLKRADEKFNHMDLSDIFTK